MHLDLHKQAKAWQKKRAHKHWTIHFLKILHFLPVKLIVKAFQRKQRHHFWYTHWCTQRGRVKTLILTSFLFSPCAPGYYHDTTKCRILRIKEGLFFETWMKILLWNKLYRIAKSTGSQNGVCWSGGTNHSVSFNCIAPYQTLNMNSLFPEYQQIQRISLLY